MNTERDFEMMVRDYASTKYDEDEDVNYLFRDEADRDEKREEFLMEIFNEERYDDFYEFVVVRYSYEITARDLIILMNKYNQYLKDNCDTNIGESVHLTIRDMVNGYAYGCMRDMDLDELDDYMKMNCEEEVSDSDAETEIGDYEGYGEAEEKTPRQ